MGRIHLDQVTHSAVNWEEAEIASSYHALLQSDEDLARQTYLALTEAQDAGGLVIQGRRLCNVLRPRVITDHRRHELCRISIVLSNLFERAACHLLADDRLLNLLGATEEERDLWSVDPGYEGFTLTSRLDSFMLGEEPKFVEYNAESPASIGFCDVLSRIFDELPAMRQWKESKRLEEFEARRHLYETLLWAYRSWGGKGTPTIAVIDWDTVLTHRDFEICAEYFEEHGVPTVITDPRALQYRQGALWCGTTKVDLVYRRVLLHELLARRNEVSQLLKAYRDGAICMVNSPRSKLLHKKGLFALLSNNELGLPLTEEETKAVAAIPWTRILAHGQSTYRGESIELSRFVLDHRERLALKPFDDYGGHGVVLGWETPPEEWQRVVEASVDSQFVVQERVAVPEAEFPIWDGDAVRLTPLYVDTDPLLFRGQLGGILTRISGSALLNVSAGTGSAVPTFMVHP